MADFRKWFIAFAVVALLSSLASAQSTTPLTCVSSPVGSPLLRAEGITELVGDLKIQCTGGTPTALGAPVPSATIQIFIGGPSSLIPITSRLLDDKAQGVGFSEAELIVDEPHSANALNNFNATPKGKPNSQSLLLCNDAAAAWKTSVAGICQVTGAGADTYNADVNSRPNVFLARTTTQSNSLQFNGVPFDPPGTLLANRTFRITNVRVNANAAGATTLVPTAIYMYLTIQTSNGFNVSLSAQTVGYILAGNQIFNGTSNVTLTNKPGSFTQCDSSHNLKFTQEIDKPVAAADFTVAARENFAAAWKPKNLAQYLANAQATSPAPFDPILPGTGYTFLKYDPTKFTYGTTGDLNQDVVDASYNSETGFLFYNVAKEPTNASAFPVPTTAFSAAYTSGTKVYPAGSADQGTRLRFDFANVPAGVYLYVPEVITLTSNFDGTYKSGVAVLVTGYDSATGAGGSILSSASSSKLYLVAGGATGAPGSAVYEVLYSDWNNTEQLAVDVYLSYKSDPSTDSPATGLTSTVNGYFAPTSSVTTAAATAPIPRFNPSSTPVNTFTLSKCSCNILFPYVTTVPTFDTGIAVVNTTLDPWAGTTGAISQAGKINLYFYNADGLKGGAPVITPSVKAGGLAAFDVFAGDATYTQKGAAWAGFPNFSGYLIASAEFNYCHGFAYISKLNDPFAGAQAYLGLILDKATSSSPGRTPYISEQLAQ